MGKSYVTTFTYDCELAFNDKNGGSTTILKELVKYLIVEHDFKTRIMPVIYAKINLTPSLYNSMVPQQGQAKMFLKLYRIRKRGSTSSAPKTVIYDEFDYFMTDDPNAYKELDTYGEESGSSYKTCIIGLVKTKLQTQNQKPFEGVFKKTNSMTLVQNATNKLNIMIQPFDNNTELEVFTCPALTSIGQFISYLNSQYSFYKGSYIYYMDFDKVYLRSNDGSYIDAKDGDLKYIAFDIRDMTKYSALSSGIVVDKDQDAYIIFISSDDASINIDRTTSGMNGTISNIDSGNGGVMEAATVDTSAISNINSNIEAVTLISNTTDPNAAANIATRVAENTDTLVVTKADMDARIFTPNKQYLLSNYEDNPKYCGVYYLAGKREIYLRSGSQMNCQITLTLMKTAEYVLNNADKQGAELL